MTGVEYFIPQPLLQNGEGEKNWLTEKGAATILPPPFWRGDGVRFKT